MDEIKRVTTETFRRKKTAGEKIVMVTAYDFPFARLVDEAGVDGILVGDSLGMVVLGYETTIPVTMEEILHHTRAVLRGARRALVVADLPFLSYQTGEEEALRNAGSLLKAGAAAVKLEGGREYAGMVKRMVTAGIPVMGHLGLTPQSIHEFGGYGLRAKEAASAVKLLEDALALAEAGVFAIVLEKIPREVAAEVTARCPVPTIGIGSGPDCDGQVLVLHDLLGLYEEFKPRFVKRYAELGAAVREAVGRYVSEVRGGEFPGPEHAWGMEPDQLATFRAQLDQMEGGTNDTGQDR